MNWAGREWKATGSGDTIDGRGVRRPALHTLVRHKGLLVADNALWCDEVLDPDGSGGLAVDIHRFHERVTADPRFEATILPVGDGLMVAVRR